MAVSFQSSKFFVIPSHSQPRNARRERARNLLFCSLREQWFAEARRPKPEAQSYRNSSIAAASTSLPGRVTDSGSVASGSSTMFSISRKLGALVFT